MKIAIIHQYYLMPGQFGGSRFNEMARYWSEKGHSVTVIAGTVEHGTGKSPERYRRRWLTCEKDGLVDVYRCHVPPSYRASYAGRMWAFLGFTFSAATAALRIPAPDVVIATSPPLIAVIPGWVAARARFKPVPWVFEMRDLWPESAVTTGVLAPDSLLTRILYLIEKWAARSADMVNVLTPAFREDILKRGLATENKICFVPNGADIEMFTPGPRNNAVRREFSWGERTVAMYAGAHSRANRVQQLIEAAQLLCNRPDILIACVGDGPEREGLERTAKELRLSNIAFYGPQPKSKMPDFVNACDIGMAVLQNNPTFRTVYPNKVFDYMSCGRPVLLAIDGVARQLVCEDAQAGIFAEPENAPSIAHGIQTLADDSEKRHHLGDNGRKWVMENAARDALADRYLNLLVDLVGRKR
jgi:glycosyltransferase involved in cell wall biosynthesis